MDNSGNPKDGHSKYTENYVKLLKQYRKTINRVNKTKASLKNYFFWITMIILIGIALSFVIAVVLTLVIFYKLSVLDAVTVKIVVGASVSVISSLLTLVIALVKLPEIIAKYLFNPDEDKHMTKIMKSIQNYELRMEDTFLESEIRLMNEKKYKEDNEDSTVEEMSDPPVPGDDSDVSEEETTGVFKDTMQGLMEAVDIDDGNIPLTEKEGMPAPTFAVADNINNPT